jgi:hypothetical protein
MSPADRDVLTSLPRSRPTRRSAKRGGPAPDGATAEQAAKAQAAAAKPEPAAGKAKAAAKPKPAKAGPKAAASRPKAAAKAPRAQAPKAASTPPPPPAGWASPTEPRREGGGTGELLTTAVQAVGELAQIGLTYGGQALRQALSRLPRP